MRAMIFALLEIWEARMVSIVILDDEPESASDLHEAVERLLPASLQHRITVLSTFNDLVSLTLSKERIDILITDIIMPEGQPSGIDIVRRLFPKGCGTQVIYVSGYLDKALDVYPTNHIYFLLKPVNEGKLKEALTLALDTIASSRPPMLRIKVGRKERLINTTTISYLRSELRVVTIHCGDSEVETYAKLSDLAPQLPDSFVRCHRSYIINLAQTVSLQEDHVLLRDGTQIPISRRRAKDVQRALLSYIAGHSKRQ